MQYFLDRLFEQKEIVVGTLQLVPDSTEIEEPVAISEETKFLCISPIVLIPPSLNDDPAKDVIAPDSDEFSAMPYESTLARREEAGPHTAEQLASFYRFQILPDADYINRIQSAHKKFARIYPLYDNDIKFEVRGYTFPFTLYAAKEVQQFVYDNGLGYFAHKGFGMLDIAHNDSIRRERQHEMNYA